MPSPRRPLHSPLFQIVLGLFLALAIVMTLEAFDRGTFHLVFGDSRTFSHHDGDSSMRVAIHGDVDFRDDESGIERLSAGSTFEVEESNRQGRRRLRARATGGGDVEWTWWVDRRERPFDAEAEAWLQEILPRIFRVSGIDADLRTARLLAEGGIEAVLEEIPRLEGDYVTRRYLAELIEQGEPDEDPLASILRLGEERIESDYELRRVIGVLDPESLVGSANPALEGALATLESDYELRRALTSLTRPATSGETLEALVRSASGIASDHELATFLRHLAEELGERPLPPGLERLMATVENDHEHRRALRALLLRREDDPQLPGLLATAKSIEGDHEARRLLAEMAQEWPTGEPLPAVFFEVASTIQSSHELRRALDAAAGHRPLDSASLTRVLETALEISNDHELGRLLRSIGQAQTLAPEHEPLVERLLGSLENAHERERVESTLGL